MSINEANKTKQKQTPEYLEVFLKSSLTNLGEIHIGHCLREAFNLDQFPAMHLADFQIHFVGTPLRPMLDNKDGWKLIS